MSETLAETISAAETLLPGEATAPGTIDPRWQAVIGVAEFIQPDPRGVWAFARRWGAHSDPDLRAAIATCLLEHLLEHHFDLIFPLAASAARSDPVFADTLGQCWVVGQSSTPENSAALRALLTELRRH